jgi:hypothetical protein
VLATARDDAPALQAEAHVRNFDIARQSTRPVRLSMNLRRLLVEQFDAGTLRHLAGQMDLDNPTLIMRRRLDDASLDELAAMIVAGRKPTIGWWRRHAN